MSNHQNETAFLRHCLRYEGSTEHQALDEKIAQIQRDERCVRGAAWLMALLTAVAIAGLCYSAVFVADFPPGKSHFTVKIFGALGLASLISFVVVAFFAFIVEAGIVALFLTFSGLATMRVFASYFITNLIIFFAVFYPLLQREQIPLPLLEALVVALDAAAIKLLSKFDALQGDEFSNLSWLRAGLIAVAGNAASFFVGTIASATPWYSHGTLE